MFYKQYKNFMLNTFNKNNHLTDRKLKFLKDFILFTYYEIPKFIVILLFSMLFKTLYETLIILLSFCTMRNFSMGIHAPKNWQCWIATLCLFVFFPLLSNHIIISKLFLIISYFVLLFLSILFAPNDTKKRPFKNAQKRYFKKLLSSIIVLIALSITLLVNNQLWIQNIFVGIVIATILYLPITYIIFKQPFYNYKRL